MGAVAGADGCRAGWLTVERRADGSVAATVYRSTPELMERARSLEVLTLDIPIGLPDNGPRPVDLLARQLLGPRASSVFPAPVRAALLGATYAEACERSFEACGKRLSKQAFAILPKIREVDEALCADAILQERVREVHPEVCFYFINGSRPMEHPKKSGQGFLARHNLLETHFGPVFANLRSTIPRTVAKDDDILDALVALWSAERLQSGDGISLPPTPMRDRLGLRMEMVA